MREFPDRNKTDLTHRVTAVAAAYLDSRGFKPVETEVLVADGWVADLASFSYPTQTEHRKLRLIGGSKIIQENYDEERFLYRFGTLLTAIVEVKTSKRDYLKDLKKKFDGRIYPTHLCYLAYPKGIIEEPPRGWIGLMTDENGEKLLSIQRNKNEIWIRIHPQNPGDIIDLVAAVAIRCHHRTRYAQLRAWSKAYRANHE